jgi:hypothetical protein
MHILYGEELLAPRPTPKLEDHPLLAVRDCLVNIFAAALHNRRACPPSATWGRAMPWWQGTRLTEILGELKVNPIQDKISNYKTDWRNHVNWMSRSRLPKVIMQYIPNGRRDRGTHMKKLTFTVQSGAFCWSHGGLPVSHRHRPLLGNTGLRRRCRGKRVVVVGIGFTVSSLSFLCIVVSLLL